MEIRERLYLLCILSVFYLRNYKVNSQVIELAKHEDLNDRKLVVVTVATEDNDGLKRYMSSAKFFGLREIGFWKEMEKFRKRLKKS